MATLPPSLFKAQEVASRLKMIIHQNYAAPYVFLMQEITKTFHGYILEEYKLSRFPSELPNRIIKRWEAVVRHMGDVDLSNYVVPAIFTLDMSEGGSIIRSSASVSNYGLICIVGTLYRDAQLLLDKQQEKLRYTLPEFLKTIHDTYSNRLDGEEPWKMCPWLQLPIVGYGHISQFDTDVVAAIRKQPRTNTPDDLCIRTRTVTNAFF